MLGKHELKALVVAPFANNILSMKKEIKKVKAWAVFMPDGIMLGEIKRYKYQCNCGDGTLFKALPITITYSLPKRKK